MCITLDQRQRETTEIRRTVRRQLAAAIERRDLARATRWSWLLDAAALIDDSVRDSQASEHYLAAYDRGFQNGLRSMALLGEWAGADSEPAADLDDEPIDLTAAEIDGVPLNRADLRADLDAGVARSAARYGLH